MRASLFSVCMVQAYAITLPSASSIAASIGLGTAAQQDAPVLAAQTRSELTSENTDDKPVVLLAQVETDSEAKTETETKVNQNFWEYDSTTVGPYSSATSTTTTPSYTTYTPPLTTYTPPPTTFTMQSAPSISLTTQQTCSTCGGSSSPAPAPSPTSYQEPTTSTDTQTSFNPYVYSSKPYLNPTPEPEIIMDPDWMIKPNDCQVRPGMCRPQCPTAHWDVETQRIFYSFVEDIEGCPSLFKPDGTVLFMFTLAQYLNPGRDHEQFLKDAVLHLQTTRPYDHQTSMSKPIEQVFDCPSTEFLPNEMYYVGAIYTSSYHGGTVNYSAPEVGTTPIYVHASEIHDLTPGQEIHAHLNEHMY